MIWLAPFTLAAIALVAAPIAVHLLTRRRALHVRFPSVQFLRVSQAASVRLRRPSDLLLLAIRALIVLLAALAAAQPLLTRWRQPGWQSRVIRAVVVDGSPGMQLPDAAGEAPASVAETLATSLGEGAWSVREYRAAALRDGIAGAVRWLNAAPPGREELVIVSDFHSGAIDAEMLAAVPSHIGLRLVRAAVLPAERQLPARHAVGDGAAWTVATTISGGGTRATWTRDAAAAARNVRLLTAPDQQASAARALRAADAAGSWDVPDRPVEMAFAGAPAGAKGRTPDSAWVVTAIDRMRQDAVLREAALDAPDAAGSEDPALAAVARNRRGAVVVRAGQSGDGGLFVAVAGAPDAVLAAASIRAALISRTDGLDRADAEVRRISDEQLARWSRPAGPPPADSWRRVEATDARWFWAAALLLLAVETIVRKRRDHAARAEADVQAA